MTGAHSANLFGPLNRTVHRDLPTTRRFVCSAPKERFYAALDVQRAKIMATGRILTGLGIIGVATGSLAAALIWLVLTQPLEVVGAVGDRGLFGLLGAVANLVR
jgi:hypothetical protein